MKRWILILTALLSGLAALAQPTRVRGRVTDAEGAPLQFVSVVFPGTTVGMVTDENGIYSLETRDSVATLQAQMMGYITAEKPVERGRFNQIDFALEEAEFSIDQVVVTPGANPAFPILDSLIRRKRLNNPDEYDRYRTETYTKMELGLTNIKESFRNKRMQRNFGFIFEYVDTSALTGQRYLPAMISETQAEYYHSRRPAVSREVIRANRISGVDDTFSIAQFTGQLSGRVNFYDNFIDIFNIRFASPLADGGRMFYNYFLIDSLPIDGRKSYLIRFHPRGTATPVLDGELHIDAETYALHSITARLPKRANINWIKHLVLENENRMLDSVHWFKQRDRVTAEFSIALADSSKMTSFIGSREIIYSNTRFDDALPAEVLTMDNDVVLADEHPSARDDDYWERVRPYRLSERERGIYRMVDSIQQAPLYRNIYTIINTIIGGYYNTKYIGIGPYYKLASFNRLEGFRAQLGGRTTARFSRRVRLSAYGAYGTKDERWKGGGGIEVVFGRRLTRKLTLQGGHDVMQLGAGQNALAESNLLSSVLSRGDQRLSMVDRGELRYEHEWRHGFSTFVGASLRRIYSNRYVPMVRPPAGEAGAGTEIGTGTGPLPAPAEGPGVSPGTIGPGMLPASSEGPAAGWARVLFLPAEGPAADGPDALPLPAAGLPVRSIDDASVTLGLRISKNERIYRQVFDKSSLGSKYPILTLSGTAGLKGVLPGSYGYYRADASIYYRPELPPIGYSEITLQGGKIWGEVPYPLLKLHEGNGTYFYDPYAFSCMDYYEFASDRWLGWFFEHHFNGFFLGRIPLLKRLKWREVLVCKGVWGSLSQRNDGALPGTEADLLFPRGMGSVRKPYIEAGFGIENIFRLLRIDCIWRLTHREAVEGGAKPQNFAVNLSLHLKF